MGVCVWGGAVIKWGDVVNLGFVFSNPFKYATCGVRYFEMCLLRKCNYKKTFFAFFTFAEKNTLTLFWREGGDVRPPHLRYNVKYIGNDIVSCLFLM